jgi:hypothetical protein
MMKMGSPKKISRKSVGLLNTIGDDLHSQPALPQQESIAVEDYFSLQKATERNGSHNLFRTKNISIPFGIPLSSMVFQKISS